MTYWVPVLSQIDLSPGSLPVSAPIVESMQTIAVALGSAAATVAFHSARSCDASCVGLVQPAAERHAGTRTATPAPFSLYIPSVAATGFACMRSIMSDASTVAIERRL